MDVELVRRTDGGAVLRCTRPDGSVTWQRHDYPKSTFFPLHDLTHLAVETELPFRRGFYGLIAEGWDIADTTGKTARGPLPPEAVVVERLVGLLDLERGGTEPWTATMINDHLAAASGPDAADILPHVTDDDMTRVRDRIRSLIVQWGALDAGGVLRLRFDGGT